MATTNHNIDLRPAAQLVAAAGCPSGHATLDALLPAGGWPLGGVTELLLPEAGAGVGELSLLSKTLARLSQAGRWLVWIAPPLLPYAPALAHHGVALQRLLLVCTAGRSAGHEYLWAAEQALAAGSCGAVLLWPPRVDYRQLRRLQLAADKGASLGFVFRPQEAAAEASPAALRLRLTTTARGLQVGLLKARVGGRWLHRQGATTAVDVRSCCG